MKRHPPKCRHKTVFISRILPRQAQNNMRQVAECYLIFISFQLLLNAACRLTVWHYTVLRLQFCAGNRDFIRRRIEIVDADLCQQALPNSQEYCLH